MADLVPALGYLCATSMMLSSLEPGYVQTLTLWLHLLLTQYLLVDKHLPGAAAQARMTYLLSEHL